MYTDTVDTLVLRIKFRLLSYDWLNTKKKKLLSGSIAITSSGQFLFIYTTRIVALQYSDVNINVQCKQPEEETDRADELIRNEIRCFLYKRSAKQDNFLPDLGEQFLEDTRCLLDDKSEERRRTRKQQRRGYPKGT